MQNVYVVDDDEAVRDAILELLSSVDIEAQGFSSANQFLEEYTPLMEGCLILDIRMSGVSGLELQQKLNELESILSIIFVTGHGDVPMAVEAMKRGAIEFIQKPFRDQELLDCINVALKNSEQAKIHRDQFELISARLAMLTERESDILNRIVRGHANKVIAIDLNLSQRTVENHRAHILEKMQVRSTTELITSVMSVKT